MRNLCKTWLFLSAALIVVIFTGFAQAEQYSYWPIDVPGATHTFANGIQGNNIVGSYRDANGKSHGFIYNGATYTTVDVPIPNATGTVLNGIDGKSFLGNYTDAEGLFIKGFLYDGTTYTTINLSGAVAVIPYDINGTSIVGMVQESYNQYNGFYRIAGVDKRIIVPGSTSTYAHSVDGSNIVGYYRDVNGMVHGFIYNGSTYTSFDKMDATDGTYANGISGNNIVGHYRDSGGVVRGFLYDISSKYYSAINMPGASTTVAIGIDGNNIVGYYADANGKNHGFVRKPSTTINPSTLTPFKAPSPAVKTPTLIK